MVRLLLTTTLKAVAILRERTEYIGQLAFRLSCLFSTDIGVAIAMKMLRKLSTIEAHFAYMHKLLNGNTQVTTCVSVAGAFSSNKVNNALLSVFTRYQILATCIVEKDDELRFFLHEDFSRIKITESGLDGDQTLDDIFLQELTGPVESEQALWRMRIIHDSSEEETHFLFTRNHAISDGYSSNLFFSALLHALVAEENFSATAGVNVISEELPNWKTLKVERVSNAASPTGVAQSSSLLPFYESIPLHDRSPGVVPLPLSKLTSERIINFCRQQGITVNQIFSAILIKSFCEITQLEGVNLFTAVSLRGTVFNEESVSNMGCLITVSDNHILTNGGGIVDIAKRYRTAMSESLELWTPPSAHIEHREIKTSLLAFLSRNHFPGIAITNLGVIDRSLFPASLDIKTFKTVVNRIGANYGVVLHLLSFNNQFSATFSYSKPTMRDSVISDLTMKFIESMEAM